MFTRLRHYLFHQASFKTTLVVIFAMGVGLSLAIVGVGLAIAAITGSDLVGVLVAGVGFYAADMLHRYFRRNPHDLDVVVGFALGAGVPLAFVGVGLAIAAITGSDLVALAGVGLAATYVFILRRYFRRTPHDLVGPDTTQAPLRCIDLSGSRLCFPCPPQTNGLPSFSDRTTFDIERDPTNQMCTFGSSTEVASEVIYSSSWDFYDRPFHGNSCGGVNLRIILLRLVAPRTAATALFHPAQLAQFIYDECEKRDGKRNAELLTDFAAGKLERTHPIVPAQDFKRYPKGPDDLHWLTLNGQPWVHYEVFTPEWPSEILYETALSPRHVIRMSWEPSYRGYFSPKHNVRAVTTAFIQATMAATTLHFGGLAQQQREAVCEAGEKQPAHHPVLSLP